MFPFNFTFDNSSWLYLITIVAIIFSLFFVLYRYRQQKLSSFMENPALQTLLYNRIPKFFWIQTVCLCLAWVFATIALAGPSGNPHFPEESEKLSVEEWAQVQLKRKSHEVIFLLDTSSSMKIADTRTGKTRLDYAKEIIDEIIGNLNGESVSLYSFTSQVTQIVPATFDYLYTRLMLRDVHENEGTVSGTDFGVMIRNLSRQILPHSHSWNKTIIILSDGEDPQWVTLPTDEQQKFLSSFADSVKEMQQNNHAHFYTIGVGSEAGGVVPEVSYNGQEVHSSMHAEILKTIGDNGQGQFFNSNDFSVLTLAGAVMDEIKKDKSLRNVSSKEIASLKSQMLYDHYFQLPLGVAIFCLLAALYTRDRALLQDASIKKPA